MQPRGSRSFASMLFAVSLCSALITAATAAPLALGGTQDLAGRWTGRMEPTNLSATLELDFQHMGKTWNVAMTFRAGPDGGSLPVEGVRVEGDSVLVHTKIEGADVSLDLSLAEDLLLGSVHVTEKGRVLAEGPAGLARASDESGQERLRRWLGGQGASIDSTSRARVIARASELFLANYVFRESAERAVADVQARVKRGEYDPIATPAQLAERLGRDLAEATGDRHVHVKFGAERVPDPLTAALETEGDLERLRRDAQAETFGIGQPRILEGNVGYIEFRRFFRADLAGGALASAMQRVAGTKALIVDLRECRGGDPAMAVLAASWLFEGPSRHWNDMLRRFDGTTTQFWTAAWLPGKRYSHKPVYVLTAQRTFSAPESFAYELQQTRRATIVGEVTGGGAHPGAWFPIDDHFSIFIPLSRYVSAVSGGDWEGRGVQPDVVCPASKALQRAHRLARGIPILK